MGKKESLRNQNRSGRWNFIVGLNEDMLEIIEHERPG
jgi:hypothetical protein